MIARETISFAIKWEGTMAIFQAPIFRAVFWGGLSAGILDAVDAIVAFGTLGFNPIQIYQSVASGVLGAAAFKGGLPTAMLGVVFHFLIAFTAAGVYYAASRRLPALVRQPIGYGLAFGVGVYVVMNYIVLPLSAAAPSPFSVGMFLNGVIGHALLVGLPIGLATRLAGPATRLAGQPV